MPVNIRLNRKNSQGITRLGHAADRLGELVRWLPEHDFRLVADGASAPLAGRLPARAILISRLRADAALHELPSRESQERLRLYGTLAYDQQKI
ncbi:MAG: hypothetical protein LBE84_03995 [Planctomycetota bacterium]|jgi:hypothetical protein|nr:hypothetical protein [Planctomycetota bacterium]